jgi:hypothetical protein
MYVLAFLLSAMLAVAVADDVITGSVAPMTGGVLGFIVGCIALHALLNPSKGNSQ